MENLKKHMDRLEAYLNMEIDSLILLKTAMLEESGKLDAKLNMIEEVLIEKRTNISTSLESEE